MTCLVQIKQIMWKWNIYDTFTDKILRQNKKGMAQLCDDAEPLINITE